MNTTDGSVHTPRIGLLVRCYEGLRNGRAFTMLAIGIVAAGALMALAGSLTMRVGLLAGVLPMIVAVAVCLAGINGAGLLLLDQADGAPSRSFGAALFGGLHSTWTALLAFLLLGLGLCGVLLLMYLLSLLARIPGVGPLFAFVLTGPGAIVLAFCYGMLALGIPLVLVAVWRGAGVFAALGRAVDIVVKRPLDTLLHFVLLALLIAPVAAFVGCLLGLTSTLSVTMFGGGGSLFMPRQRIYGGFGGSPLDGAFDQFQSAGAAGASVGMIMLVVVALFVLVGLLGYIMIHDSLATGLEGTSEDRLQAGMSTVRRALETHRPQATTKGPASPVDPVRDCAGCGARMTEGDRFCGECGQAG
ncbi:hypothetical protein L2Y94_00860 [Luteibacter aegosomatis]|uniref:hypothetical protein n=1 Tax=Luteibacter aegosomatis TaxID=2911537 RepID=UPI001FFA47FA|nr:hypothetical protein [Luteibacter aegosomatis]UPG85946.1 hypothetical protein L2Y94_00860 [Luteibacter aegosomatis]